MKTMIAILVVIGAVVGGAMFYASHITAGPPTVFRTVEVKQGDLCSTITATGTVEPEEVVDVGAQVVGRIKSLGADPSDPQKKRTVDFSSTVHEGTVLALIDDALYKAQVDQAAATLQRAKADLLQYQAKHLQAEQEWKRAESLRPKGAIADTDYDLAVANYKAAKANVAVGEAAIQQNAAALDLAKTNLNYTVIKSPVEGTIIARRVNIGQTVVASLNAPSLFLIAKDLRRIQVWASVNEADIGRVHLNMPVRFTVDAFPGEVFRGKVSQIRLNAASTQNVVTYTVVVATDNADGRLLPYLTANLQFEIEQRSNVLLVPNGALRWKPRKEQIASARGATDSEDKEPVRDANSVDKPKAEKPAKEHAEGSHLWIPDDSGQVRPISVVVGPSDGSMTQVSGNQVKAGMKIVIGESGNGDTSGDETTNPFAPKMFGKKRM